MQMILYADLTTESSFLNTRSPDFDYCFKMSTQSLPQGMFYLFNEDRRSQSVNATHEGHSQTNVEFSSRRRKFTVIYEFVIEKAI